jgi:hypothetical protein
VNVSFLLLKALILQVNILMWTLTLLFLQVTIPKFSSSDSLRLRPLMQVGFAASTLFVISFGSPLALLIESVWIACSTWMTTHFFSPLYNFNMLILPLVHSWSGSDSITDVLPWDSDSVTDVSPLISDSDSVTDVSPLISDSDSVTDVSPSVSTFHVCQFLPCKPSY